MWSADTAQEVGKSGGEVMLMMGRFTKSDAEGWGGGRAEDDLAFVVGADGEFEREDG